MSIIIKIDENNEWLQYGQMQSFAKFIKQIASCESVTTLGLRGNRDAVLIHEFSDLSSKEQSIVFTGDRQFAKKIYYYGSNSSSSLPCTLVICFSRNDYSKELKQSLLERLFKTKGFRSINLKDIIMKYSLIFIGMENVVAYLRSWESKIKKYKLAV